MGFSFRVVYHSFDSTFGRVSYYFNVRLCRNYIIPVTFWYYFSDHLFCRTVLLRHFVNKAHISPHHSIYVVVFSLIRALRAVRSSNKEEREFFDHSIRVMSRACQLWLGLQKVRCYIQTLDKDASGEGCSGARDRKTKAFKLCLRLSWSRVSQRAQWAQCSASEGT